MQGLLPPPASRRAATSRALHASDRTDLTRARKGTATFEVANEGEAGSVLPVKEEEEEGEEEEEAGLTGPGAAPAEGKKSPPYSSPRRMAAARPWKCAAAQFTHTKQPKGRTQCTWSYRAAPQSAQS